MGTTLECGCGAGGRSGCSAAGGSGAFCAFGVPPAMASSMATAPAAKPIQNGIQWN
jgi:hypothetical protein